MFKTIKSNEINGFISAQLMSANSITVVAELTEYVRDARVRLVGEIEVSGTKLVNPILEDIDGVIVVYHQERTDGALATAYFVEGIPGKLLADIQNYVITDFEIEGEVCPCCGR